MGQGVGSRMTKVIEKKEIGTNSASMVKFLMNKSHMAASPSGGDFDHGASRMAISYPVEMINCHSKKKRIVSFQTR